MGSLERTGPATCLPVGEALSCERGPCAMSSPGVLPASPHQGLLHAPGLISTLPSASHTDLWGKMSLHTPHTHTHTRTERERCS